MHLTLTDWLVIASYFAINLRTDLCIDDHLVDSDRKQPHQRHHLGAITAHAGKAGKFFLILADILNEGTRCAEEIAVLLRNQCRGCSCMGV